MSAVVMVAPLVPLERIVEMLDDALGEFPCDGVDHERKVYEALCTCRALLRGLLPVQPTDPNELKRLRNLEQLVKDYKKSHNLLRAAIVTGALLRTEAETKQRLDAQQAALKALLDAVQIP